MENILHEPKIIESYYQEYFKLINYYSNVDRTSVFVKYFNIDFDNSVIEESLNSSYKIYSSSGIKFNLYEQTPVFYIGPLLNMSSSVPDLRGQMMDAMTSIVTYSIERPRIHDIVSFYSPILNGEIFRVDNIKTSTNAIRSDPAVNWYELDLEYAPIVDLEKLNTIKNYIYDLSAEKYIDKLAYIDQIKIYSQLESYFNELTNKYYDAFNDLYRFEDFIPLCVNELIIMFKSEYDNKYKRLFEFISTPYGYYDVVTNETYYDHKNSPFNQNNLTLFLVYNFNKKVIEDYRIDPTQYESGKSVDNMIYICKQIFSLL